VTAKLRNVCAASERSGIFQWNMRRRTKVGQLALFSLQLITYGLLLRIGARQRLFGARRVVSDAACAPPDSATISSSDCASRTVAKAMPPPVSGAKP